MSYDILLADDDDSIRFVLNTALTRAGHTVKATDNADTLLKWAASGQGDIILTDVMMNGEEVFERLPELADMRPHMPVIVISANNTVNTALKAGTHKVFEYVPKPFDLKDVVQAVNRAGLTLNPRQNRLNAELSKLPMIGRSAAMQPVYRAVSRYASGDLPVLIHGAVGTGKDLVARLLHEGGHRKDRPFLRSTDFSNTSLTLQKVNGGDLYIDEIAELSAEQQEGLLAIMSEAEHIPPARRPRVLSATRKDLRILAEDGHFRDDLLFRINVAEIRIPDLSDRDRDIYELAEYFLAHSAETDNRRFESKALNILHRHNWAGNVRELENLVRRLAVLYSDDLITADMVLQELTKDATEALRPSDEDKLASLLEDACEQLLGSDQSMPATTPYQTALEWVERPLIKEALRLTGGNRAKAADILGIHRNTLRTRLKSLEID